VRDHLAAAAPSARNGAAYAAKEQGVSSYALLALGDGVAC
jgi:hypothetical protein